VCARERKCFKSKKRRTFFSVSFERERNNEINHDERERVKTFYIFFCGSEKVGYVANCCTKREGTICIHIDEICVEVSSHTYIEGIDLSLLSSTTSCNHFCIFLPQNREFIQLWGQVSDSATPHSGKKDGEKHWCCTLLLLTFFISSMQNL